MADPASVESQDSAQDKVEAAALAVEVAVLSVIAKRLGKLTPNVKPRDIYAVMPDDIDEINATINNGAAHLSKTVDQIMDTMAAGNDEWAAFYFAAGKREQIPYTEHARLQETLKRETETASKRADAMCRSSVVALEGREIVSIEDAYKRVVNAAATNMAIGEAAGQSVIAESVKVLSQSGLRVVYGKGGTRELYTAVSTNVMDAYRTAMNNMREIQGLEFGADGVQVSAHELCAKDHQPYQGRMFSYSQWSYVQYSPTRPLVTGANCHHTVSPVIMGISPEYYTGDQLADMVRKSNESVSFIGMGGNTLTMSRYEASQYQRRVETSIRKMRTNANLLEDAQLSSLAKIERANARDLLAYYKSMSAETGLDTRLERTRSYVLR